jgi:phosphoglycerate kinase
MKTLSNFNLKNKLVLIRLDLNSPIVKGRVLDNPRFAEAANTIKYLIKNNAKVIILAHQGRKGEKDFLPLKQHAKLLSKHIKHKVAYITDLFGNKAHDKIIKLKPKNALLLENVRFFDDELNTEKKNNRYIDFSKHFDLYVNEAFSVSHRKQGSIVIPPKYIKSCIGLAFAKELSVLNKFNFSNGKNIYLIGGQKVEDYFPIFNVLKKKNNLILASGVLANLILAGKHIKLGYENLWLKKMKYARLLPKLMQIYNEHKNQIILPVDFAINDKNGKREEISFSGLPTKEKIWDVGHETTQLFKDQLQDANAVFMKGPLGYSELPKFSYSTIEILKEVSNLTKKKKITSLLGGGHLTTTIKKYEVPDNFSHISTSGGALIAYLSGEKLPGLNAIKKLN